MDSSENTNLLEAEGELNKEIQTALQQFRQKIVVASSAPQGHHKQANLIKHY